MTADELSPEREERLIAEMLRERGAIDLVSARLQMQVAAHLSRWLADVMASQVNVAPRAWMRNRRRRL